MVFEKPNGFTQGSTTLLGVLPDLSRLRDRIPLERRPVRNATVVFRKQAAIYENLAHTQFIR